MAGKLKRNPDAPIKLGIIGLGHWGPNHLRVLKMLPGASVLGVAELDRSRHRALAPLNPEVKFHRDYRAVLDNEEIQAVVVATHSSTHYQISREALLAGKDVLCEKPMALTSEQCRDLIRTANRKKRILMVAHIFMYNPGILKIKEYLNAGRVGDIYYVTSVRTNLGPIRDDVNVVFDLAAHDVSIFNFILGSSPSKVVASGTSILKRGREDFCFVTLHYPGGVLAHLHISWLTPRKQREILVVGSNRMITWNDLDPIEPVKVYRSHSTKEPFYADYGAFQRMARISDVHLPAISPEEPLLIQCRRFLECVRTRSRPLSDGANGLKVIQTLEKIQEALSGSQ
jgi:predicted dehydrogenase